MPISVAKLTELFGHDKLRNWIKRHSPMRLREVDDLLNTGAAESAVQAKVVQIYNEIYGSKFKDDFIELIKTNYPDAIVQVQSDMPLYAKLMVAASDDPNKVFSCYHPNLLRFPMQIMFFSRDGSELEQAIIGFRARLKNRSEFLIIGNRGYVEYIPENHRQHLIPEGNWEIKKHKPSLSQQR